MTEETTPPADPPTPPTPPADPPVSGLEGMTDAQIETIKAQIAEREANRPPNIAAQLEQLQEQIAGTVEQKEKAVNQRKQGRDTADALEKTLADLQADLRRREILEAVGAAEFAKPDEVVKILAGSEGDVADVVAAAAASGAFAMKKPAPTAPIGGPSSQSDVTMDPGKKALMEEIRAAQGG